MLISSGAYVVTDMGNGPGQTAMTRALLTDGERAAFTDESMDENTAGSQRSRVRSKVRDRLPEDIRILREHDPELLEEVQRIVCERELEERIRELENRVDELESG